MDIVIIPDKRELGKAAGAVGADLIRQAIESRGIANIIVATGASQFEVLEQLVQAPNVAWHEVVAFHLDEYIGLPITHPASFRAFLWQRFVSRLPLPLRAFHYVDADPDPRAECRRLGELIKRHPIDVAFVGIGENGHLAFNDPPADFTTEDPYLVVNLDDACRSQQLGEGWFPTFDDVPRQAISMSVRQIMKSRSIICTVPDERKAAAAQAALEGDVTPNVPASILQQHERATIYLDQAAASKLRWRT
jgi:glucosamine-6-phosphate deaminase